MSLWQWRIFPVPVRRLLFRIAPGRWTQREVEDIRRRAAEKKAEMDRLTE